ncbi:MAG: cytochrome c biogenesis protein ResB [Candidatus Zipacnadales bacterium]
MSVQSTEHRVPPPQEGLLTLQLLRGLQSVRMTIYLLPILAVATTIGAIIPQGRAPEYYSMIYGPIRGHIIVTLGFHQLYTSTWFIVLIALLLLNLAACAGRSWRRAVAQYHGPTIETLARKFATSGASAWAGSTAVPHAANRLESVLRRARYVVKSIEDQRVTKLFVRRWPTAYFASIVMHLAIFLIAIGAVLGCLPWTSLDTNVTLVEGEIFPDEDEKLGFAIRLDDFRMDFYEETGTPSSYESDLTLLVGGREVKWGTATVNRQVTYRGIALGQSSWALAGVRLTVENEHGATDEILLQLSELPGAHGNPIWNFEGMRGVGIVSEGHTAVVGTAFLSDVVERDGSIIGLESQYPRNPAVALQLATDVRGGEPQFHNLGWLKLGESASGAGYTVRFDDLVYVSTLSARRDPGLPFVWTGAILTSLGMIVVFYVRPRTFLIESKPGDDQGITQIRVVSASRDLMSTDRRLIERACEMKLSPLRSDSAQRESA